jgi:hypothetical protein
MEIERRTKIHMLDHGPVVRERGGTRTNRSAHLENLRQLEITHDRRRRAVREIVPQAERMADFVRHDVPQVVVLLFQISIRHGLGQDEHVRVENLTRQRVALDV